MAKQSNRAKRSDGLYKRSITIGRKEDGNPIRKYFYAKTIKELDRIASDYDRQRRMGTLSADENATFGQIAKVWLRDHKPLIGERQRQEYAGILSNHLAELHAIKLKELKPLHLQAIINRLATEGYAEKTLASIKQTASQVVELAMQNDIVFRNVFAKVSVPRIEGMTREPITDAQKELILQTWREHRMGIPALIMLFCGLRRGEMLALTWRDIDLNTKTITVNKAVDYAKNGGEIKAPKSKAGNRIVPIPDAVLPALQVKRLKGSMMVCPAVKSDGMMSLQAYQCAWNSYQHFLNIKAGGRDASRSHPKVIAIKPFTAHQLRHTYATMLYDAGVDVKTAQKLLGHADLQVTMRIYHIYPNRRSSRPLMR